MMPQNESKEGETIRTLFDMQKFMPNERLQPVIEAVGNKYGLSGGRRELSDEEMEVWAAGDWAITRKPRKSPGEADE